MKYAKFLYIEPTYQQDKCLIFVEYDKTELSKIKKTLENKYTLHFTAGDISSEVFKAIEQLESLRLTSCIEFEYFN